MPDQAEVHGLLALMLLHDSRREAREQEGELVLLLDQDRRLWDWAQIAQGRIVLDRAVSLAKGGAAGDYVLQAAISSLYVEQTPDWHEIAALYGELSRLTGSPVVELNRAIAVAEERGPQAGLAILERLALRTSTTCTRHAVGCCGASVAPPKREWPTSARWRSCTTRPSGDCSSDASASWPSSAEIQPPRGEGEPGRRRLTPPPLHASPASDRAQGAGKRRS